MPYQTTNPQSGQTKPPYDTIDSNELEMAIQRAHQAYLSTQTVLLSKRVSWLLDIKKELLAQKSELATLMQEEMGKPISQGVGEIEKCALLCEYYANSAPGFLADRTQKLSDKTVTTRYEAMGPLLAVMPWNFPFWQVFRVAVPAICVGNPVLLKHAENVPQCALALESVCSKNLPAGLFQNVFASHKQCETILDDPRVRALTLTGSSRAGSAMAQVAGRNLKKSVLELGGSDAFIVFENANIEEAALQGASARCVNTGQSCIAAKRFLIEESVLEKFMKLFCTHMQAQELGPLANRKQLTQLEAQVTDAVSKGAKVHIGGKPDKSLGLGFEATVLSGITKDMDVFGQEVFGPVALVFDFKNEEEAVSLANNTDFGLGGSLWSADEEQIDRVSQKIQTGSLAINAPFHSDPRVPFGGTKTSGYGKELGREGLLEFTNQKVIIRTQS